MSSASDGTHGLHTEVVGHVVLDPATVQLHDPAAAGLGFPKTFAEFASKTARFADSLFLGNVFPGTHRTED